MRVFPYLTYYEKEVVQARPRRPCWRCYAKAQTRKYETAHEKAHNGEDDGARTRELRRDNSFWRTKARMVAVVVPLLHPRPPPCRPLPQIQNLASISESARSRQLMPGTTPVPWDISCYAI
jgi:hypothetical protein